MPTVFVVGSHRYYFFSREETRMHVHVSSPDGEAKIWLEPTVSVAKAIHMSDRELGEIVKVVEERREEIADAWSKHFDQ